MSTEYEKLLSKDPIGAFKKINENYLRYFTTMYRFKDDALDDRKNDLLKEANNLYSELFCELLPKYESSNKTIEQICNEWDCECKLPEKFSEFIKSGLMSYTPYRHQYEMLKNGYGKGENVLITSGTGSGKTESFMLPILASLLSEANQWNRATYDANWYKELNSQRNGEDRPAAIRTLLLYPMNALVADQVARLRKTLDSENVRGFLDNNCNGNRIFFGSYNGNTLRKPDLNNQKNINPLESMADKSSRLTNKVGIDSDDIYVIPRFDNKHFSAEMLLREDMQETPPDILITNISMLSIMLMRSEEQKMLDATKQYFEENSDAVFHLVVDELHLHRGTAGAEVAFLLRMFLNRIGVLPMRYGKRNPQLRIYASSASIENNAETYLQDFFGIYGEGPLFHIQKGYDFPLNPTDDTLDYNCFEVFVSDEKKGRNFYYLQNEEEREITQKQFLESIPYEGSFDEFIRDFSERIYQDLLNISPHRAFSIKDLKNLPGNPSIEAIRGFLIFRGAVNNNEALPNIRFHQFYKYVEGLWGELLPDGDDKGPIGELSYEPKEVSPDGSHKMLELLRCECCGELFIGGNRKVIDNNRILMTLNQPDIEKIPNMQATPMVQRKTIEEYVVFWPNKQGISVDGYYSEGEQSYERFGLVNINGKHTLSEDGNKGAHGAWKEGYLNPYDGSISSYLDRGIDENRYIRGFYYYPKGENNNMVSEYMQVTLKALPCKCPACNKDYLWRKYTQSPIRSFRTGMGRNNQLLSKELLYQLDAAGNSLSKLISFSDSRQDAAELSKLVSREHYRDMVRLAFIKIIKDKIDSVESEELRMVKEDVITDIDKGRDNRRIMRTINQSDLSQTEKDALLAIIDNIDSIETRKQEIEDYIPEVDVIDLNNMISTDNAQIDGELIEALLKLGINPSGTDYADMYPLNNKYWDQCYDFDDLNMIPDKSREKVGAYGKKILFDVVYENLQSYIFKNCFGQYMNVNTEVAGLGYVVSADVSNINEVITLSEMLSNYLEQSGLSVEGVINALIRVFGDHYRYNGDFKPKDWNNYNSYQKKVKNVIKKISELSKNNEQKLGNLLNVVLQNVATDQQGKLQLNKPLRFKLAHQGDPYYECDKCGCIHLHRGFGLCTNTACLKPLPDEISGYVEDLWESNYISFDVIVEPREPRRLHSEELTGQTDNQADRLLKFKDIILGDDEHQMANQIDLLSVTTTMEVGVDIGSLQAIYQGNVPPTRYNYQQRVGRAGRRGQAYSAAVTFCRGRSHDNYFYGEPMKIITDRVPDPTLAVNPNVGGIENLVILKRVILKHIIMLISADKEDWKVKGGTCGQLGGSEAETADWEGAVLPVIKEWFKDNEEEIDNVIRYYVAQYDQQDTLFNSLQEWIESTVDEMNTAVQNGTYKDNAQAIMEAGLLPIYGMPVVVRKFYHGGEIVQDDWRNYELYNRTIERPLELAISEFAPGAVKTKDSAEYVSAGITIPLDNITAPYSMDEIGEYQNKLNPLEHSYNITLLDNGNIGSISQYDSGEINPEEGTYRLVIPKAFRTEKIINNQGNSNAEDDTRTNFMPISVWVDVPNPNYNEIEGGTAIWSVWNGAHQFGNVWYINDNNGRLFEGRRAWKSYINKRKKIIKASEPKFIGGDLTDVDPDLLMNNAPNFMSFTHGDGWHGAENTETIALGAKKVTDILCLTLDLEKIPLELNLNANAYDGFSRSAIIAGFYSAATLIQRTFADSIDVQPEEIEISEVKIDPDSGMPSVYLNDKAANGAGFISLLLTEGNSEKIKLVEIMEDIVSENPNSEFIKKIRSEDHSCDSSCPNCLNTFYNRGLHHVLDWRLGMDIIKLMLDCNYNMGYENLADTPYHDLSDVFNKLGERIENSQPEGGLTYHHNEVSHPYFVSRDIFANEKREYLIHPFWRIDKFVRETGFYPQTSFKLFRNVKMDPEVCNIELEQYQDRGNEDNHQEAPQDDADGVYGPLG
ncbi:MAG: DEAD/DEAH box helicase [Bacteroidales bacterium]|nr:DEAD/DEAH box helicase [Bacteroidales bacterium]